MPRVTGFTPSWLCRPSPGFEFFTAPERRVAGERANEPYRNEAPPRTTAVRGTEIFHALGNEIRWSDLALLREAGPEGRRQEGKDGFDGSLFERDGSIGIAFRLLKIPISREIKQLVLSPNELFLAIVTSHTVHVAILPDRSHFSSGNTSLLKLKTFQVGPTTHVLERSMVAAALWHPLGRNGDCLVTVTADANVRLWELKRDNRWSFDMPTLAIDLKKLANGVSGAEDFSPSKYGTSTGFSPDSFEMEVASACFGPMNDDSCTPWAPMTLWVAMKGGDIYALCPLLPEQWQSSDSLSKQLSSTLDITSLAQKKGSVDTLHERDLEQRMRWISELQRERRGEGMPDGPNSFQLFRRPSYPSTIPKIQGPFRLSPDPDQIFDISDIHVLSTAGHRPTGLNNEEMYIESNCSTNLDLILLATCDSKIHVCACLRPVEPRWLPLKKAEFDGSLEWPEILVIETIFMTILETASSSTFTPDNNSVSSVLVTSPSGVSCVDCSSLVDKLGEELNSETNSGAEFRINMLSGDARTSCQSLIKFSDNQNFSRPCLPTAAISILDVDIGQVVIATAFDHPSAVTVDLANVSNDIFDDQEVVSDQLASSAQTLVFAEPRGDRSANTTRPPYQPPSAFWTTSTLPHLLQEHVHPRNTRFLSEEVRLSPSTLKVLMEAHRILSLETHRLGLAAADLFSQCERLQDEFTEQLYRAREVAERVDAISGDDTDIGEFTDENGIPAGTRFQVSKRLDRARMRQETLILRQEALRSRLGKMNGRPFGEKEKGWASEIGTLGAAILSTLPDVAKDGRGTGSREEDIVEDIVEDSEADRSENLVESGQEPQHRFIEAKELQEQLMTHFREVHGTASSTAEESSTAESHSKNGIKSFVARDRRRARSAEIEGLLDRQTALVEATREKLGRLQGLAVP